jgi:hypothetical protein
VCRGDRIESPEDRALDVEILGDRLDDEVG